MLHVACYHLARMNWKQAVTACKHARAQRASADAFVGMAVADAAVERKVAPRARTAWVSAAAHTVRSSCTASIAAERCRLAARADRGQLQRCREGAVGGRDRGAPGRLVRRAAATLQGTPQRRRWALVARMVHRVCCALPASVCSHLPHLTLCSVLRCLFVCLFVCLLVTGRCKTHRRWRGLRCSASSRVDGLFAVCCAGVRCACAGALPPTTPSRVAQAHCTSAYA